ncbi:hypothetical protein CKN82_05800 [Carnobacterium divergens]|uniref:hypothetical protein n=1 Tax=Carnobacterium divergens TaxID=2748 RepID=UPI000E76B595|nr:hypothetical protein [Carnobacterium divergens]AOA00656.1 hypothetical protein BFC22_11395 [Carnobacterium divergens]MDT1996670.1 hypothetical protein [Carnobacterium divergens]TFI60486.1 hypothetical protein CKN59_13500 [Carnobacterium divergens]TFI62066.1 hypothetical protein CKN76_12285 [Carnobacterium divergens]TFI69545.1 hypothetical protein CKN70_05850 [Carnobacterium divergens]
MSSKWLVKIEDRGSTIFEKKINGDNNARSLFIIKQIQILSELNLNDQIIQSNPLAGEARGLMTVMPNDQVIYMIRIF